MNRRFIPKATLGRLPLYLQYLKKLPEERGATISSAAIARALSLGEVQVRKDLASVSGAGKPKIGYDRSELVSAIEFCLGYDKVTNAVLIGAGKLGKALMAYEGFEEFGVKVIAGFDRDGAVLQTENVSKPILPISDLKEYCKENDVKIGIITVGKGSAQQVCDTLVDCGISAIWNFAPCALDVPPHICFKQENLALSLAHLNIQLA